MKKLLTLALIMSTTWGWTQQDPLYAQYMLNPLLINPAYAGINNNFNAMVGYRTQWTGLDGQPMTIHANAHTSVVDNNIGVGFILLTDRIGNTSHTETNLSFAYKINLRESVFSYGMQASVQTYSADYSELTIFDPLDNAFLGGEQGTRLNLGAGAILKSEKYFIGLSVPRWLPTTYTSSGQEFELYNQHYYVFGGYVLPLNRRIWLKPTALLRGVRGASHSVDFGVNVNLSVIHTAGVFIRNFNTYGVLLQTLLLERFRFGYVFEIPAADSVGTQFTTHEIMFGIQFSAFHFHDELLSNF